MPSHDPQPPSGPTPGGPDRVTELLRAIVAREARTAADEAAVPERLRYVGDYELLGEIARGGMGVVFRARQTSLDREVAVKMILAGELADEDAVQRFRSEAEAAAQLRHPGIVAIHEIGEHLGQPYFSMELVEGESLAEVVRRGPLPGGRAAGYLRKVAEAVHYAHTRGVLHRDLKPSNVLVDAQDEPRVTDFGLAKRIEGTASGTLTGTVLGTPAYLPPEQALGNRAQMGPRSDVYSLGALLYELLTGAPPFRGETPLHTLRMVVDHEPPSPRVLNPAVPEALDVVCMKCLEKLPERRYASAQELADDLGRFLERQPVAARAAGVRARLWSWLRSHPWTVAAVAGASVVVLVALAYGLWAEGEFWRLRAVDPAAHRARAESVAAPESGGPSTTLLLVLAWTYVLGLGRSERSMRLRARPAWPWFMAAAGLLTVGFATLEAAQLVDYHVWAGRRADSAADGWLGIAGLWGNVVAAWILGPLVLARAVTLSEVRSSGAILDLTEEQEDELRELLITGGKRGFRQRLRIAEQRYVDWTGADSHHARVVLGELWTQERALRPDRVPPRRDWLTDLVRGGVAVLCMFLLIELLIFLVTRD